MDYFEHWNVKLIETVEELDLALYTQQRDSVLATMNSMLQCTYENLMLHYT